MNDYKRLFPSISGSCLSPIFKVKEKEERRVLKWKKKEEGNLLLWHQYLDIYSVLSESTSGSLQSSWVWCQKVGMPGFGDILPFFPRRSSQVLSGRMSSIGGQTFLGLCRCVWLGSCRGSCWLTSWHSQSCPRTLLDWESGCPHSLTHSPKATLRSIQGLSVLLKDQRWWWWWVRTSGGSHIPYLGIKT